MKLWQKIQRKEAVLLSNGNVFTKDGEMSLNQWLRKVFGWSTVDTYNYSVHKKTGKTLKVLRDEYMKDREKAGAYNNQTIKKGTEKGEPEIRIIIK